MSYAVKGRVEFKDDTVIVLKPVHVSLGRCALCNNFVRRYSSVNDLEIESMLKDGCVFRGYKKVKAESVEEVSVEEEAFSNMHFVLLLSKSNSADDEVKQVCIRRIGKVRIRMDGSKSENEVVTSSNASSVIIIIDKKNKKMFLFHFKRQTMKRIELPIQEQHQGLLKFELVSDVLYIGNTELQFVNFNTEVPFFRKIYLDSGQIVLFYSNEMVALAQKNQGNYSMEELAEPPYIVCDMLRENIHQKQIVLERDILALLLGSTISALHINNKFLWVVFHRSEIRIFKMSGFLKDLIEITTLNVLDLFVNCDSATYKGVCYCQNTQQAYIVYTRTNHEEVSSSIVGLDLQTLKISCVLDLQLTLNRRPEIKIHVSPTGHKLFVQETFDDKLIFFQVFKLLPADLKLKNIAKQFIWDNLSEASLDNHFLPKDLRAELEQGF